MAISNRNTPAESGKRDPNKKPIVDPNTNNADPASHIGDLIKESMNLEIKVQPKTDKQIDKQELQNFINDVAKHHDITPAVALVGIFSTLQAGGTSKNKRSNVKIKVQGTIFESKKINEILMKNIKEITPRQFARLFASAIFNCSVKYDITGNAFVYLKRFHSEGLTEAHDHEKYWCADFQIDNPQCPEYIREALRIRYAEKFQRTKR